MKVLFIHDVKAWVYKEKIYARSYGKEIWNRYLKIFDSVVVCTRSRESTIDISKDIELLSGAKIFFDQRVGMFKGPEIFFSKRIKRILNENIKKTDGVIIRLDSFLGLLAAKECRQQNKPYVIEVVGCAWDSFWNHGLTGKILAPFIFLMMRRAVKKSPFTVYVTKQFLQSRYPTDGVSINISNVSLPEFNEEILKNRIIKIEKTNFNSTLHLMTTANVGVKYKGFQYVIIAMGIFKKRYGSCKYIYHIVGEGDQTFLRKLAKKYDVQENVVFHGALAHSKVFNLLKEIDIYIQPSLQEGLPRALIEAMSYALPCIGTDVAGIPELIDKEYMYTRNRKMPKQILSLLAQFNKEKLKQQALRNFKTAKDYDATVLNERRSFFLREYIQALTLYNQQ